MPVPKRSLSRAPLGEHFELKRYERLAIGVTLADPSAMTHPWLSTERCVTLTAGAAATGAMMLAAGAMRSPVMSHLQELAATVTAPPGSAFGEAVGYAAQLANGALFTEVYRAAFDRFGMTPSAPGGAALGLGHGVIAGVVLAAVPPLHPRVPEQVPAPGAFMRHRGTGEALMLVALHGLYGALVGAALSATTGQEPRRASGHRMV